MALIRLFLLLGLAGGLFLLVQFNWSPLQLTFLGVQTPALPLALWILSAIAVGMVTNLLITSLFSFSNYFAVRAARSKFRQTSRQTGFQARSTPTTPEARSSYTRSSTAQTAEDDADWNNWEGYEEPAARQPSDGRSAVGNDPIDDWDADPSDDWDADEPRDTPRDSRTAPSRTRNYETKQEPRTTSRSGSVYSYSYREPEDSGVGKAEPVVDKPVVDADYRVIVPPFRSLDEEPVDAPSSQDADDWFEEDGGDVGNSTRSRDRG